MIPCARPLEGLGALHGDTGSREQRQNFGLRVEHVETLRRPVAPVLFLTRSGKNEG